MKKGAEVMTERVLQIDFDEERNVNGFFDYEPDSKRYHRFQIKTDKGIVGTMYVPKDR